jgi:hypothetical protein
MLGTFLKGALGTIKPVCSFLYGDSSSQSLTTYTYTAVPFGSARSDRIIVVSIVASNSASRSVSSVTIGGVSATLVSSSNSAAGLIFTATYYAVVPTGTSGTVSVVFSGATRDVGVGVYSIVDASSSTPLSGGTYSNSSSNSGSITLSTSADAVIIGGVIVGTAVTAFTWSGVSSDFQSFAITRGRGFASGTANTSSTTVSVNSNSTSALYITAASWR